MSSYWEECAATETGRKRNGTKRDCSCVFRPSEGVSVKGVFELRGREFSFLSKSFSSGAVCLALLLVLVFWSGEERRGGELL